jgi:hypothetical protein
MSVCSAWISAARFWPDYANWHAACSAPIRQVSAFYVIRVEEKSTQPVNEVMEPISQEIRQAHVTEWFQNLTKRFEPTVESVEFFTQPSNALPPQPAPKPPAK